MQSANVIPMFAGMAAHPNELDRRRIERLLKRRKRYRYVSPNVEAVTSGYRIESPCCSRNIDREGGVVDIALLLHDAENTTWQLFRKEHAENTWQLHSTYERLHDVLNRLNADPERTFWQ